MSQTRGSCGHLKGNYDNHSSCLNCTGCFRSSCCSVCLLGPDSTWSLVSKRRRFSDRRKICRTKEEKAKAKKKKDSASRDPSGSRSHLEQTVARTDPTGSTADGRDDDNASALSLSSSGGERVRGDTGVPGSRSSHGTPGPSPAIWQVSTGFRLLPKILRLRFLIRTPHRAILTRSRYQRIDHLGLSQNARWNDSILATSVKTPG